MLPATGVLIAATPWPSQYHIKPWETNRLTDADVVGPDGIVYPDWTGVGVAGGIPALDLSGNYKLDSDKGYEWIVRNYGGAVLKCAGSHMLDMTLWLLGRPQALYAHVDYVPQSQLDRKVAAVFEYPQGMTATFETAVHPLKKIGYERNSWDEFIEINGANGRLTLSTVMWDQPERNPALLTHYDNTTETVTEYRGDIVNPFHVQSAYFADCLARQAPGAPDVLDGFNVDVLIEAMQQSAAGRAAMTIDWRGL